MRKKIANSPEFLPETNVHLAAVTQKAQRLVTPDNFFVGLPDGHVPLAKNVLMFLSRRRNMQAARHEASHQRHLLVFNLMGAASMLIDGLVVRLEVGQALMIFPYSTHRYLFDDARGRMQRLFVSFEMEDSQSLEPLRSTAVDVPAEVWPMLDQLLDTYGEAFPAGRASPEAVCILARVLLRLIQADRHPSPVQPQAGDGRSAHARAKRAQAKRQMKQGQARYALASHRVVQQATQYIASHLSGAMAIGDVAHAASVSQGYLRVCFRQVLGTSVVAHIRRTRVQRACTLLSRTEANMMQIADHCGFGSVYVFSRAFKQEIGRSPRAYRNHLWEHGNKETPGGKKPRAST